jgi:U3 small nucleolar RNA-associated protein 21
MCKIEEAIGGGGQVGQRCRKSFRKSYPADRTSPSKKFRSDGSSLESRTRCMGKMSHADDSFALPAAKRQRLEDPPSSSTPGSRLFTPFRSVGLVSPTTVPFCSVPLGKSTFQITTCVGRSLQTYDLRRGLQLVFLSRPQCPDQITAVHAYRDRVLVAWGGLNGSPAGIWVTKRGRAVDELEMPRQTESIKALLVFGSWIIGCTSSTVEVWKSDTYEHYTSIASSAQSGTHSNTVAICTMPTYLNKIFVGRSDGSVEIYNVSTGKLVHTVHPPSASSGSVTALAPANALCVLTVAHSDGSIRLIDVDTDDPIISLSSRTGKPVTSIAFRADGVGAGDDGRKDGVMATASIEDGDISLWDLNKGGRLAGVIRAAHETSAASKGSGITSIEFLPGQPVLVSSGLDNALRSWIFDRTPFSPIPRPLHSRSGHSAPVTELMFLPAASDGSEAAGKWLLSAGQDRSLWGFSLRKDGQNTELSQGDVNHKAKKTGFVSDDRSAVEDLKAPPIVDLACCLNRDGGMGAVSGPVWSNNKNINAEESSMNGWESVITAHANDKFARTWSWGRKKAGRWAFQSSDQKPITSVSMTACGTFGLIGSVGGIVDAYNLQSGTHRQRFPPKLKPAQAKQLKDQSFDPEQLLASHRGHKDAITGIMVDNLNKNMVTTSLDGSIIFWDFATGTIAHRVTLDATAALTLKYNPVAGLVALSCDDLCIRIIDIEAHRIVRELWGCVGQINDLCFSHDGHWIVACSMDSVIRVFDLATGHLIDAFKTSTCTNVAFSSTGEYLATTHAGTLGINIWTNKSLFTHVATRQIDESTGIIDLTSSDQFETSNQLLFTEDTTPADITPNPTIPASEIDQLESSLLTLSLLPRSRWQTLLNLDAIRARNKPVQPPEKPKAAPFFLGSALTISSQQISLPTPDQKEETSRITTSILTPHQTDLSSLLTQPSSEQVHPLIPHLLALPPSSSHLALQTLFPSDIPLLLDILTTHLCTHRDYEVLNTWVSLILKLHGDFITDAEGEAGDDIRQALQRWMSVNEEESKRLEGQVGYVGGVVGGWMRTSR